jgi:dTDP-4-dehydrorhamnose reductase
LVDDLSKMILKILERELSGIYHASGKTCLNRYDFALKLAEKFGLDQKLILPTLSSQNLQLAPRPKNGCLDSTKLEKLAEIEFSDIDSGISHMYSKSK